LETATRQLDQMIDQARYRHHQHRSKFKEAIDYLDQIFEDLKKEGDQTADDTHRSCPAPVVPIRKGSVKGSGKQPTPLTTQQQPNIASQVKLRSQSGLGVTEMLDQRKSSARYFCHGLLASVFVAAICDFYLFRSYENGGHRPVFSFSPFMNGLVQAAQHNAMASVLDRFKKIDVF
uniref:CASP-like protein n=1 Tax=Gongylonema pulchrum TaxID=637853 RepID=A0A183D211_9BILA